jgi:hypothetical protein
LAVIFFSVPLLAASTHSYGIDKTRYRELFQKLSEAAKQKDWQGARDVLTEIGRERPVANAAFVCELPQADTMPEDVELFSLGGNA